MYLSDCKGIHGHFLCWLFHINNPDASFTNTWYIKFVFTLFSLLVWVCSHYFKCVTPYHLLVWKLLVHFPDSFFKTVLLRCKLSVSRLKVKTLNRVTTQIYIQLLPYLSKGCSSCTTLVSLFWNNNKSWRCTRLSSRCCSTCWAGI